MAPAPARAMTLATAGPWIGYAAGAITVIAFLPQVVRVWRTKQTHDLSRNTYLLLILSCVLWLTYGFVSGDAPVIATNAGLLLLNASVLIAKLRFG